MDDDQVTAVVEAIRTMGGDIQSGLLAVAQAIETTENTVAISEVAVSISDFAEKLNG